MAAEEESTHTTTIGLSYCHRTPYIHSAQPHTWSRHHDTSTCRFFDRVEVMAAVAEPRLRWSWREAWYSMEWGTCFANDGREKRLQASAAQESREVESWGACGAACTDKKSSAKCVCGAACTDKKSPAKCVCGAACTDKKSPAKCVCGAACTDKKSSAKCVCSAACTVGCRLYR